MPPANDHVDFSGCQGSNARIRENGGLGLRRVHDNCHHFCQAAGAASKAFNRDGGSAKLTSSPAQNSVQIRASFPFGISSVPYPDEARAKTRKKHQARFVQTRR